MIGSPGKIAKARYQDAFDSDIFAAPVATSTKHYPPGYRRDQMTSELFGDDVFYKDLRKQEGTFEPRTDPLSPRRKKLQFLQGGTVPETNQQDLDSLPVQAGHSRTQVGFTDDTDHIDHGSDPVVRRHQELESHIFPTHASVDANRTKIRASGVSSADRAYAEQASHLFEHAPLPAPSNAQKREQHMTALAQETDDLNKRRANIYYSDLFGRETPASGHLGAYHPKPVSSPESKICIHGEWSDSRTNAKSDERPMTAKERQFRELYRTEVPEQGAKDYRPGDLPNSLSTDTSGKSNSKMVLNRHDYSPKRAERSSVFLQPAKAVNEQHHHHKNLTPRRRTLPDQDYARAGRFLGEYGPKLCDKVVAKQEMRFPCEGGVSPEEYPFASANGPEAVERRRTSRSSSPVGAGDRGARSNHVPVAQLSSYERREYKMLLEGKAVSSGTSGATSTSGRSQLPELEYPFNQELHDGESAGARSASRQKQYDPRFQTASAVQGKGKGKDGVNEIRRHPVSPHAYIEALDRDTESPPRNSRQEYLYGVEQVRGQKVEKTAGGCPPRLAEPWTRGEVDQWNNVENASKFGRAHRDLGKHPVRQDFSPPPGGAAKGSSYGRSFVDYGNEAVSGRSDPACRRGADISLYGGSGRVDEHEAGSRVHQKHLKSSLVRDTFYERAEATRQWEVAEVSVARLAPTEDEGSIKTKCRGFGCHIVKVILDLDPISNMCKGRGKLILRYNPDENDLSGLIDKIQHHLGWQVLFLGDDQ
eukprot:g5295.t1